MIQRDQDVLLQIVCHAVQASVYSSPVGEIPDACWDEWQQAVRDSDELQHKGACFVTLQTADTALRGCIGSLQALRPLWRDAALNAGAAAAKDPRFAPVTQAELASLQVEISVLGKPQELEYSNYHELCQRLVPHEDGVVLSLRGRRATFLPQVWQRLPNPEVFLNQLCRKAGLSSASWRNEHPAIAIYNVYTIGPCEISRYVA